MRNLGPKLAAGAFAGFLLCFSAFSMALPEKGFSESENRYLQKKPDFTISGLLDGSFGEDYEAYLGDQFPMRDRLVGLKVLTEQFQGKKDVNGVYLAKDGYLIEKFDREEIESEQLNKNLAVLTGFVREMAESLGKEHVRILMAPSASQVLTDQLPAFAAPYDQSQVTERLEKMLEQESFTGLMVPAESALREEHPEQLYYRTDHHWTADGAYYAYRSWAESIGLKPWGKEMFEETIVTEEFYGTVYSKVNVPCRPDSIKLFLPKETVEYEVTYDGLPQVFDSLYQENALKGKDKYSVYLDGNHGLTQIRNLSAGTKGRGKHLMIVKDSFAHSFAPFAVNHFETVTMVDLRYFNKSAGAFAGENGVTDLLVLYQIPGFSGETAVSKLSWQG